MTTYTIKRSEWNGMLTMGTFVSQLYESERSNHNKCCLGIIAGQLKLSDAVIADHGSFEDLADEDAKLVAYNAGFLSEREGDDCLDYINSDLSHRAININDSQELTPPQKEAHLITLFAEHNITLIFED